MNNRTVSHFLTHNGETLTIRQWSRRYGVHETTIHTRLRKGWPVGAAISLSADSGKKWIDRISEIA
jgi:lambda repressor-like predicted transcriptional regulator